MADTRALETRLGKDKAYSRASGFTDTERSMGFVCPRADAYGAREGVIPPGVAAVNGLVPKGMRRIAPGDTAKHANAARDEGVTDVEQYREYYAQGAEARRRAEAAVVARRAPSVPPVPPAPPVASVPQAHRVPQLPHVVSAVRPPVIPQVPPPAQGKAPPKGRVRKTAKTVKTAAAPASGRARRLASLMPAAPAPASTHTPTPTPRRPPQEPVFRDPDDARMFSPYPDPPPDDNTLDGFYEGLGREQPGTAGRPGEAAGGMVSIAGDMAPGGPQPGEGRAYPAASPAYGDQDTARGLPSDPSDPSDPSAPSDPPDSTAAALASLVAERDRLLRMANDLSGEVGRLREMLEGYAARDQHYAAIEEELAAEREARKSAEAAVQPPAETVRVALSEQEQKLKVGGRGWECNIMGALHFGRSDRSLVLTVSDPGYASDLFAEIQPGEVAVLSAAGRTSCAYSGRCAKIYGDAGSPDFIAVLWLDVAPTE